MGRLEYPFGATGRIVTSVTLTAIMIQQGGAQPVGLIARLRAARRRVALLAGHLTGGGAWPVIEVLLVATGYATGPLIASRKLSDLPGLGMTAVCLAFAAVVIAPAAVLTLPHAVPPARVIAE